MELSSCISFWIYFFFFDLFEIWDKGLVPPGELPLRYPVGLFVTFFSKSRAKLSS